MTADRILHLAMRMTELADRADAAAERSATAHTARARATADVAETAACTRLDRAVENLLKACREHRAQENCHA